MWGIGYDYGEGMTSYGGMTIYVWELGNEYGYDYGGGMAVAMGKVWLWYNCISLGADKP